MIPRQKSYYIIDFINKKQKYKNVLIVDGVRQVGKTSAVRLALQQAQKPYLEINLETQKLIRDQLEQTHDFTDFVNLLRREFQFVPNAGQILFIDEANESLRLGHYVRQMKEDWPEQTVILSGSMMHRLFRDKNVRIPVGRYETLTLSPFHFAEFLQANQIIKTDLSKFGLVELATQLPKLKNVTPLEHQALLSLLQNYLNCGGMPQILLGYLSHSQDRMGFATQALAQYLSMLKEDFLKIFSEEYANLFLRVVNAVANLQGYPFKKSAIVKNNDRLAENLLSVFESWKFVHKVEQKNFSQTTANSFHPKRYLFDVGLARHQREMGMPTIDVLQTLNAQQREPLGGLIEQLTYCELACRFPQICGYKESTFEVDFVIKWQTQSIPIECKASLKPNQSQYRSLDLYQKRFGSKIALIISLAPYSVQKRQDYQIIHIPTYAVGCVEEVLRENLS